MSLISNMHFSIYMQALHSISRIRLGTRSFLYYIMADMKCKELTLMIRKCIFSALLSFLCVLNFISIKKQYFFFNLKSRSDKPKLKLIVYTSWDVINSKNLITRIIYKNNCFIFFKKREKYNHLDQVYISFILYF